MKTGPEKETLIRKAGVRDARAIKELIDLRADRGLMLHKSLSEIYDNLRDFWVLDAGGPLTGCAGLHVSWEDLAEIKSLSVHPGHCGRGNGSRLLSACISEAAELGVRRIFALTYVKDFFLRHGFREIDKSGLPHKIWSECVKCPKFPDCDETAVLREFDISDLRV